ncbi:50S ribosomal protein L11 methyltransferase [Halodesulfovibrio sp.]|jgi:ribosomal protein L11 methyltransferase|uniref:50S ribosomal protein L11 methyltransferase n=1 Tax=Halodesulfovibrio sp. TaxID=1912772 RepID=UPI0025FDF13C|nr:50S ribosomal protein L11 methyltransferase [Halodesulfovibrio sp.]MCT4626779.1 50S ribosomal protein L11 methyltransferase [Halodesulfovibrio sp.]
MSDLVRLEIRVPEQMQDMATLVMVQQLNYGWEEENLPTGDILYRVHIENPAFCEEFMAALHSSLPEVDVVRKDVPNQDWMQAWREFFTPVEIGEHFKVIAPWMRGKEPLEGRTPIVIEPKTAFGTGHHPTTALCLSAVSKLASEGRIHEGQSFLDLGTGSGILGIGCVKLGLTGVGVDIDMLAIENTEENKVLNDVSSDAFEVYQGSADAVCGDFDVVLANILARPLMEMAVEIIKLVKPGGCLVLSGLLAIQADQVEAVYRELGLPEARRIIEGEWAALIWE